MKEKTDRKSSLVSVILTDPILLVSYVLGISPHWMIEQCPLPTHTHTHNYYIRFWANIHTHTNNWPTSNNVNFLRFASTATAATTMNLS